MNDENELITIQYNDNHYISIGGCSIGNTISNSFINDTMMHGMDWKEVIGVYIEHNFLPQKLRDKIVHNR